MGLCPSEQGLAFLCDRDASACIGKGALASFVTRHNLGVDRGVTSRYAGMNPTVRARVASLLLEGSRWGGR